MPSWLITGASRGIGLTIVEDLLKNKSNFVVATARNPSGGGLETLTKTYPSNRLAVVQLDVTNAESIAKAVETITPLLPNGLDYFISNAGVNPQPIVPFEDIDLNEFLEELKFNTVTTVEITRALLPLVRKSEKKKILYLTSILGSVSVAGVWPVIANTYGVSKAALNMIARKWGSTLKTEGIAVSVIHPGWVVTDIGDSIKPWMEKYNPTAAQITTKQSSEGIIKVAETFTLEDATSFFNYDGTQIGW